MQLSIFYQCETHTVHDITTLNRRGNFQPDTHTVYIQRSGSIRNTKLPTTSVTTIEKQMKRKDAMKTKYINWTDNVRIT
jgi:hypothetical protein